MFNPDTGQRIAGPITIHGYATGNSDGFTVLPSGHFLINDFDGDSGRWDNPDYYREYDMSGNLISNGLKIDMRSFGFPTATGVTVAPDGQSLYFMAYDLAVGLNATIVQTDLQGNLIGFQPLSDVGINVEDIDAMTP